MAASSANQKIAHHARSISLPSGSHPLTLAVEEQINRLRSSDATTSSASISQHLCGLKDLYECVEDLLLIQDSQRSISNDDSALNGSLALLDICSTTRDVLSKMKQSQVSVTGVLKEVEATTLASFESILSFLSSASILCNSPIKKA